MVHSYKSLLFVQSFGGNENERLFYGAKNKLEKVVEDRKVGRVFL